jgi:non-heme chloroperoxidase
MTSPRRFAAINIGVLIILLAVLAGMIVFGTRPAPQPMASISAPFAQVDFTTLPKIESYAARDGTALAFRTYRADPKRIVVMVHGSSTNGSSLHPLATAVHAAGYSVYTLDIRGHGASGPLGDIAYYGQLDHDVQDLVDYLRKQQNDAKLSLVGFSSGGAFALRTAGGENGGLFDRYVLISPALPYNAPTMRQDAGGWVQPYIPRIIALTILNNLGIHALDHLTTLAFAVDPNSRAKPTATYSFGLMQNFAAHADFRADIRNVSKPMRVLVGNDDTLLYAEQFVPLFTAERTDIPVTVMPDLGHIDMSLKPEALAAVLKALESESGMDRTLLRPE